MPPIPSSQKTAEEKWYKSADHKHDAWRGATLARHLFEVHGLGVQMTSLSVENHLLRRAKMTRAGLGKRLRLPVLEKTLRAFVDPRVAVVLAGNEGSPEGIVTMEVGTDSEEERACTHADMEVDSTDSEDAEGSDEDTDATTDDPAVHQGQCSCHSLDCNQ